MVIDFGKDSKERELWSHDRLRLETRLFKLLGRKALKVKKSGKKYEKYIGLNRINFNEELDLKTTEERIKKLQEEHGVVQKPSKVSKYDSSLNYNVKPDIKDLIDGITIFEQPKRFNYLYRINRSNKAFEYVKESVFGKQISFINSWLTCTINQMYLEYCEKSNTVPKGRISVPEHFIHDLFLKNTVPDILESLNNIIDSYVDKDGRVYFNSVEKYIKNSLKKDKENRANELNKYKERYRLDMIINEELHKDKEWELEVIKGMAEMFVSRRIHPKYRQNGQAKVLIDSARCEEMRAGGFYEKGRDIVSHRETSLSVFAHEIIHKIMFEHPSLTKISYDHLYESTKGNEIKSLYGAYSGIDEGSFYKTEFSFLEEYAARIYEPVELYRSSNEVLTVAIGNYLCNVEIPFGEIADGMGYDEAYELVDKQIMRNFEMMCEKDPALGRLVAAFFNGEL